ncbi:Hsp20 family protein [Limibaculum sp. M0105]|uniref:Hsp20 family protein n=1 Tax=Thermohalobaculum xanthum TaxID=2753746 RepID=A0A8J7M6N1_9RHOB|nr:Hsp20 family protein [Thermohalobaculum xanthum]MBK0399231.1 Hsp20 family protein [Thermohalobaculum xanthum]
MRTLDLSPLYRSTVGFDRLAQMLDQVMSGDAPAPGYPPYNIEKTGEDAYRITLAVAGFGEDELNLEVKDQTLTVTARKQETEASQSRVYLHRGIAERGFERRFQLADHVKVNGAELVNGLLHVDLVREVPEALKPRNIAITTRAPQGNVIEG